MNRKQTQIWLKRMDGLAKHPCQVVTINISGLGEGHYCAVHRGFMSWVTWSDERKCELPRCFSA